MVTVDAMSAMVRALTRLCDSHDDRIALRAVREINRLRKDVMFVNEYGLLDADLSSEDFPSMECEPRAQAEEEIDPPPYAGCLCPMCYPDDDDDYYGTNDPRDLRIPNHLDPFRVDYVIHPHPVFFTYGVFIQ